jgi:hypothetical protein
MASFQHGFAGGWCRGARRGAALVSLLVDAAGNHVGTIVAGPNETREAILPDGTPINHPLSFDPDLVRPAGGNLYGPSCTAQNRKDLSCSQDFAVEDWNTTHTYSATGKLTWPLGDVTLTSVTDYRHFSKFQGISADGGPASTRRWPG